jgi:hypothetical protein
MGTFPRTERRIFRNSALVTGLSGLKEPSGYPEISPFSIRAAMSFSAQCPEKSEAETVLKGGAEKVEQRAMARIPNKIRLDHRLTLFFTKMHLHWLGYEDFLFNLEKKSRYELKEWRFLTTGLFFSSTFKLSFFLYFRDRVTVIFCSFKYLMR